MNAFYLLVWCEDSGDWHQADECEASSDREAKALLLGRNPRLAMRRRAGDPIAIVPHGRLDSAYARNPEIAYA